MAGDFPHLEQARQIYRRLNDGQRAQVKRVNWDDSRRYGAPRDPQSDEDQSDPASTAATVIGAPCWRCGARGDVGCAHNKGDLR